MAQFLASQIYGRKASTGTNWITVIAMTIFHIGAVAAFFFVDWGAIAAAVVLYYVAGSFGIGERLTEDNDFPYYVFRIGLDLALGDRLTWNIATFRYRNAFDTDNDYETPRWSSKLTVRLDDHNAIYGEIYRNLDEEWEPTETGITGGYAFSF